ncbi:MAG: ABC transporter permease [Methylocystis sp.]|nr:ABC transporter permease [Rhodobacter sp.]MCA3586367.1 ABC transporter permease [Methylocystis sp.]
MAAELALARRPIRPGEVERPRPQMAASDHPAVLNGGLDDLSQPEGPRPPEFVVPREVRRLYGPVGLLVLWTALAAAGLIGARIFPPPWEVLTAAVTLTMNGQLQENLLASLQRVALGSAIGLAIGLFLAVISGTLRRLEDIVDSLMQILDAVPNFTLVPLLIIWAGINEVPKVTLITLSVLMPIYINTYGGIRNVDQRLIEVARTLGLGYWSQVRHIVIPGALPNFFVGLRVALTNAWTALVFAETINSQQGLGALMSDARSWWQLDIMVLVIVIYAILGLTTYTCVRFLERWVLSWRRGFQGS